MLEFKSSDRYVVDVNDHHVTCYAVTNPFSCHDFKHLNGSFVVMNGWVREVIRVERFCHLPPYLAGEKIGLMFDREEYEEDAKENE